MSQTLDMRGKTITTYIVFHATEALRDMDEGNVLAAALEGADVSIYFRGPAVKVLTRSA